MTGLGFTRWFGLACAAALPFISLRAGVLAVAFAAVDPETTGGTVDSGCLEHAVIPASAAINSHSLMPLFLFAAGSRRSIKARLSPPRPQCVWWRAATVSTTDR